MAVWGTTVSDVFVVGQCHTIQHFDGSRWSKMETGLVGQDLYGVWGDSGTDVFAVGTNGTILRYDGSSWTAINSGVDNHLYGVWGSGPNDVFAVGRDVILHWNGASWSRSSNAFTINAVWGTSGNDVFAAADNFILHYDGERWTTSWSGTPRLYAIRGRSARDVYAAGEGGAILHFNGRAWTEVPSGTHAELRGLYDDGSRWHVVGLEGTRGVIVASNP
jgi:hypothetical protein